MKSYEGVIHMGSIHDIMQGGLYDTYEGLSLFIIPCERALYDAM